MSYIHAGDALSDVLAVVTVMAVENISITDLAGMYICECTCAYMKECI